MSLVGLSLRSRNGAFNAAIRKTTEESEAFFACSVSSPAQNLLDRHQRLRRPTTARRHGNSSGLHPLSSRPQHALGLVDVAQPTLQLLHVGADAALQHTDALCVTATAFDSASPKPRMTFADPKGAGPVPGRAARIRSGGELSTATALWHAAALWLRLSGSA